MAAHCLPSVQLTESGRPVLFPTEIECSLLSNVDLDSEDSNPFPHFKSGTLIVTTHRLIWLPNSTSSASAAVPLSAITHIFNLKKSMFASPRVRFQASLTPGGRVDKSGSRSIVITVVMRGKGDCDAFVAKLWENWRARAWESDDLADFVRVPLEKAGGMINLIDVYCLFNRARGTELISPEDLLQACGVWEKFDVPVMLRKFESGVMVIQHKSQSDEEVLGRIKILVTKSDALRNGISASDAAMTLGIAPAMAKEHLLTAETRGLLCRDVSPEGFRFYINLFPDINTDEKYLVKDHSVYAQWAGTVSAS